MTPTEERALRRHIRNHGPRPQESCRWCQAVRAIPAKPKALCWHVDGPDTHGEEGLAMVYSGKPQFNLHGDGPDGSFIGTAPECVTWLRKLGYTSLATDDGDLEAAWRS